MSETEAEISEAKLASLHPARMGEIYKGEAYRVVSGEYPDNKEHSCL